MSFASFDLNKFHIGDRVSFKHPITQESANGTIDNITLTTVTLTVDSGQKLFMAPHQILLTKLKAGGKNKKLKNSKKSRKSIKKSKRKKRKSRRRR